MCLMFAFRPFSEFLAEYNYCLNYRVSQKKRSRLYLIKSLNNERHQVIEEKLFFMKNLSIVERLVLNQTAFSLDVGIKVFNPQTIKKSKSSSKLSSTIKTNIKNSFFGSFNSNCIV